MTSRARSFVGGIVAQAGLCAGAFAQDPIWTVNETGTKDVFGVIAEWVGDVDGDGMRDLLASSIDGFGTDTVRLLSGRDGTELHAWTGGDDSAFGDSTSDVGDVDGDGTPDVAILDFFADDTDNVSVYSGADFSLLYAYDPNAPARDAAPLGDFDGDGHDDFVVGVPSALNHGAVRWISGRDGSVLLKRPGSDGDTLGWQVRRLPDLTGDGFPEVAASSPFSDDPYIRLLDGRNGNLLFDIVGPAGFAEFGYSFHLLGDWNGDGVVDLLVSSPTTESSPGMGDGAFAIVSCADGSLLELQYGAPGEHLGSGGAALGDVNGDGTPDFALNSFDGTVKSARIVSGRTFNVLYRWPLLYQLQSGTPDVDGDGIVDFVRGYDESGATGELVVCSGNDLWLHAEPDLATAGDTVTFETLENDPGLATVRVLVEVDGTPVFLLVPPIGTFGADRRFVDSVVIPPGLGAHHLVYVAIAQKSARGGLRISGREVLDLH